MVEERNRAGEKRSHNLIGQSGHLPGWFQTLSGELFRKSFHLLAFFYAAFLYALSDPIITWGSALYIGLLDGARLFFPDYHNLFLQIEKLTGRFIREREKREISDATRMTLGIALSLTLFGKWALLGLAVSIPGDALASLVGRTVGGPKVLNGKSLSGYAAFVLWSVAVGVAVGKPIELFTVGVIVGLIELLSTRWENTVLGVVSSFLSALLLGGFKS